MTKKALKLYTFVFNKDTKFYEDDFKSEIPRTIKNGSRTPIK